MKISRIALSALTAGVLVLGSSAAAFAAASDESGYRSPGVAATVSDPTPAPGQSTQITIDTTLPDVTMTATWENAPGATPLTEDDVTIAGTKSLTKPTVGGSVTFTVTFGAPGVVTLQATDPVTHAVLATQVVTVVAPGGGASSGGSLATTGSNELPLALGAAGLVVIGAGGVVLARRRAHHR